MSGKHYLNSWISLPLLIMLLLSVFGQTALACEHSNEVLAKFRSGVVDWPGAREAYSIADVQFNSEIVASALENYSDAQIEKMFDDDDPEMVIVKNPAGIDIRKPSFYGVYKLYLPDADEAANLVSELKGHPDVNYIYRNSCIQFQSVSVNDPLFDQQWALENTGQAGGTPGEDIKIRDAWEYTTGSDDVIVAVIDGPIEQSHEDLTGRVYGESGSGQYEHGTNVAGIIGANTDNGIGIAGINWNCKILSEVVYENESTDHTAALINDAVDSGAHIINTGYRHIDWHYDEGVAFAYAYNMNLFSVAPSGNEGSIDLFFPAFYNGVFCVGATDHRDLHGTYSNRGSWVDVSAPGGLILGQASSILTTTFNDSYTFDFGHTSAAAAHVSGVASLLKSFNPDLWNDDIAYILRLSADDFGPAGWDSAFGWGRINAYEGLKMIAMPNYVMHDETGNGSVFSSSQRTFYLCGVPNLADGAYAGYSREIRKDVTFAHPFDTVLGAWGRGPASNGYIPYGLNFGWLYSNVVEGSVTNTGMTVRTYVFELWDFGGDYVGYVPCTPSEATMAYTVVGVPSCYRICGDANGDYLVNIQDAVYLIDYVMIGGDPPVPLACGDANGDETVNVSDVVKILNYVFVGGDPPGDCSPGSPNWIDGDCCPFEE